METKCAPTYANIVMGIFEETHLSLNQQKVQLYPRYIDDTFFIWTSSENELQQFISKMIEVHPSIKFDFNYSNIQIHFSDITIAKTSTRKLLTTLYKKEITGNLISIENQSNLKLLNEASPIRKR